MKGDLLTPSENGMVKLGNGAVPKKQQINVEDAQKWRNDVLAMSRPKAAGGFGTETPEMAREYVRQIRNSTVYMNHSDSEDDRGTVGEIVGRGTTPFREAPPTPPRCPPHRGNSARLI